MGFLLLLLLVVSQPAESRQPSNHAEAARATVFIKVERRFRGMDITTTGSGFFVNSSGFILTNRHVIGETIEGNFGGEEHEINVTILSLTVVVEVGTSAERELPAKVIAEDRKRDLALLQVGYQPAFYLEPQQDVMPKLTDEISVIGYPFGELLSMDDQGEPFAGGNPEPSINLGRVTSIRRDQDGKVVAIQTDAAINPGNSGGPMLGSKLELVGVVYANISGGDQLGFAISPNRVWDFITNQSVKVRFKPPYVFETRAPIDVSVMNGMYPIEARRGVVRLEGKDIDTVEIDLAQYEDGWRGLLEIPAFQPDRGRADSYIATVCMFGAGRRVLFERRYRIERRGADAAVLSTQRSAADTMRDRSMLANRMSITDYAKRQAAQAEAADAVDETIAAPVEIDQEVQVDDPEPEEEMSQPQPELAAQLAERGRQLMVEENYAGAVDLLSEALELDPSNEVAAAFLELALEKSRGAMPPVKTAEKAAEKVADSTTVPQASAPTVNVTLRFDSPLEEGTIKVSVDGSVLHTVPFSFKGKGWLRDRQKGGRVMEQLTLPSGRHTVSVALSEKNDLLGERSFSEYLDVGSEWSIRITLHDRKETPGFFFIALR